MARQQATLHCEDSFSSQRGNEGKTIEIVEKLLDYFLDSCIHRHWFLRADARVGVIKVA